MLKKGDFEGVVKLVDFNFILFVSVGGKGVVGELFLIDFDDVVVDINGFGS